MVIDIQTLIETLKLEGSEKTSELSHMVLESIAANKDNIIMTELMVEMLQRNALLNRQLEMKIREVERLSVTDQLTGLFNRRRFLDVFVAEMDRMVRYNNAFSLIMFDIDHFKQVNDTYGHDVGDFVLQELSREVGNRLRSSDTFARWGGEEFMILAPETGESKALELAEILRKFVESHDFSPVPLLTCSFGIVVSSDENLKTIQELTKAVDEALYEAKHTGRNRVVSFSDLRDELKEEVKVTTSEEYDS